MIKIVLIVLQPGVGQKKLSSKRERRFQWKEMVAMSLMTDLNIIRDSYKRPFRRKLFLEGFSKEGNVYSR